MREHDPASDSKKRRRRAALRRARGLASSAEDDMTRVKKGVRILSDGELEHPPVDSA